MKLEELRKRLEDIENMDNLEDLKRDTNAIERLPKQIEELNKQIHDMNQAIGDIKDFEAKQKLVDEVSTIIVKRDRTFSRLEKSKEKVANVKQEREGKKQAAKQEFAEELQANKSDLMKQIDDKKTEISKMSAKGIRLLNKFEEDKEILNILANRSSKTQAYRATVQEKERCLARAQQLQFKIKEIRDEINNLQQQVDDIDTVLSEIDVKDLEKDNEQPIIEKTEEKASEEPVTEKTEEKVSEEATPQKIEEKKDGQQSAIEKDDEKTGSHDVRPYEEVKRTNSPAISQAKQTAQPVVSGQKTSQVRTIDDEAEIIRSSEDEKTKWEVQCVTFTIKDGNKPRYYVKLSKGKENTTDYEEIFVDGPDKIEKLSQQEIDKLETEGIVNAEKYYDKGMALALEKADKEYGTSGLKEYKNLMKEKELLIKYPEQYVGMLGIRYNLSDLEKMPENPEEKSNLKYIKRLARANKKIGLTTYYEKAPNFFQRLWKKITTKFLPEITTGNIEKTQVEASSEEAKSDAPVSYEYKEVERKTDEHYQPYEPGKIFREKYSYKTPETTDNDVQETVQKTVASVLEENSAKSDIHEQLEEEK